MKSRIILEMIIWGSLAMAMLFIMWDLYLNSKLDQIFENLENDTWEFSNGYQSSD